MNNLVKIRIKFAIIPLIILVAVMLAPLPFYFYKLFNYRGTMPLIIFLLAFVIFFFGAWWDFGARNYLRDVMEDGKQMGEFDVKYINRQQLIMTLIFIMDGVIYMMVALAINYF
jgi:hypothetical protein